MYTSLQLRKVEHLLAGTLMTVIQRRAPFRGEEGSCCLGQFVVVLGFVPHPFEEIYGNPLYETMENSRNFSSKIFTLKKCFQKTVWRLQSPSVGLVHRFHSVLGLEKSLHQFHPIKHFRYPSLLLYTHLKMYILCYGTVCLSVLLPVCTSIHLSVPLSIRLSEDTHFHMITQKFYCCQIDTWYIAFL